MRNDSADLTYVIAGAGLAGAKAAQTLRAEGFSGHVVLIGQERELPYERPPLSKDYLLGESETAAIYVHDASWYADNDIDVRLGAVVTRVRCSTHEVELADGSRLHYDKLLLATGASPRQLPAPGADLDGVHYLRTVGDSERLRDALRRAGRVVVCGGGWIGLETAAAARSYGADVTVVEPEPTPLHRILGAEVGEIFADLHRRHGVDVLTGTGVKEMRGAYGRVKEVVTDRDETLAADMAIVAVGALPHVELAAEAGLAVEDGIVTDLSLRTKDPDVYAAGDVANTYNPMLGRSLRVEHWDNAIKGGQAAARSMLGQSVTYDPVPYFFTSQYDMGMEYSGRVQPHGYDEVIYRGDVRGMEFVAFWLTGRRVVAGMSVNVGDVTGAIKRLVRAGSPIDREGLADPSAPLETLL